MQQGQMPAFLSRQVPLEDLLGPNSKKLELLGDIQNFLGEAQQVGACHISGGRLDLTSCFKFWAEPCVWRTGCSMPVSFDDSADAMTYLCRF